MPKEKVKGKWELEFCECPACGHKHFKKKKKGAKA